MCCCVVQSDKINPAPAQSTRVTRSMKQQLVQKPLKLQDVNTAGKKFQPPVEKTTRTRGAAPKPTASPCKELATRGSSTRSANKPPVTAAPASKDNPKDKCADLRTTRRKVVEVAPSPDQTTVPACIQGQSTSKPDIEQKACPVQSDEEAMVVDQTITLPAPSKEVSNSSPEKGSFAPEGFLFQAPHGLNSFKFDPLTPRSADAFLTPSSSFTLPPAPVFDEPKAEEGKPSPKFLHCSPPASLTEEPKHDVPYFRSEIAIETDKLVGLCVQWEPKVDEESIPEEMRDRMRTAVGQARLLMKERFKQFSGLVDDCEFSRGEKMTTCTDLQGFWDMVYFQVEDVVKKFDALKAAEACGWVEEHKPPSRQRKIVKNPAPAPSKPAGTKAAAKSRLAAAKAAMKARQQAAESTEQTSQDALLEARSTDTVVNNGGSFKVKSPAKSPDSIRISSRRSAMVQPQQSPSSNYLTPRRMTRQSLALAQTPAQVTANPQPTTPSHPYPVNKTPAQATLPHATPQPETSVSLRFSPVKEVPSDATEQTEGAVSDPGQSIPSISVEEQDKPGEDLSLRLSQSPWKSPVSSPAPMPSASLSFTLSPCTAQLSSPVVSCTPRPVQSLLCTQDSLVNTPESCVHEDLPSVDFERYLLPSRRDSLSPRGPFAMESTVVIDVDMESPRGQPESPLTLQETVSCTLPYVPAPVSFQSPQTAESALLPFTPELKDRIRQSVCPADLMVFTPPL
uniref:Discs, large (Drosophila) homolog-associated protein 5 n=1 Tax=Neogobius melanostomus TaxID=47308 RepID=A0A8C6TMY3_9GOBI